MKRILLCLFADMLAAAHAGAAAATTVLADQPLFATASVPGNLLLSLSVEYPTAIDVANISSYASATVYPGYFDPNKCYTYYYNALQIGILLPLGAPDPVGVNNPNSAYFKSAALANNHVCSGLWSGNFLNWATMATIDPFRQTLTGGYRAVDTTTTSIIERAWESTDGVSSSTIICTLNGSSQSFSNNSSTDFPDRNVSGSSTISGATPFSFSSLTLHNFGQGNQLVFSSLPIATTPTVDGNGNCTNTPTPNAQNVSLYTDANVYSGNREPAPYIGLTLGSIDQGIYSVAVRVKVCDTTVSVETNCTAYGSNNKPEGLMQSYSQTLRFGVFGYLDDSNRSRDGGVLRARMNFVGPTFAVYGSGTTTNPYAEYSAIDGTFITNPDSGDAADTNANSNFTLTSSQQITQSGAMNYVNKFGEASRRYKSYDPVSELYYASVRYYRNLPNNPAVPSAAQVGNVPQYTYGYSGYGDNPVTATDLDGFPVITNWYTNHAGTAVDPIQYSCQKNFVLGIGDVNTHADGNLPNNPTFDSGANEPTIEPAVAPDITLTEKATDQVGVLEGLGSTLGDAVTSFNGGDGDDATYGMAGIAYDAHVSDIRPDIAGTQTITTFWLDVQEYQAYHYQNQFWLTAKYGGFTVPAGWSEFSSTPSQITTSMWNANGRTDSGFPGGAGNALPDNYFSAGQPALLQSGLVSAFKSIALQTSETTTAFSSVAPVFTATTCNASYGAGYTSGTWTGSVVADSLSSISGTTTTCLATDSNDNVLESQVWNAATTLENAVNASSATGWKSRIIATSSSQGAALGIPFESANLSSTELATFGASSTSYVNYIRGDRSNEGNNGAKAYRSRAQILGDIVNSQVLAVAAPSQVYTQANNPGYPAFVTANASRGTIVYVGGNDGMLHAFDGSTTDNALGKELFAYVPSFLFNGPTSTPSVNGLASYGNSPFVHHYFVDSTPVQGDVDFANTQGAGGSGNWHTILVGGLGKGGMGYYALDITTPSSLTSESALAAKVLWEFPAASSTVNIGYSYGRPTIAKTKRYGWVVLIPSGYDNPDGIGRLFVVDPATGTLLQTVSTASGSAASPSGLAQVEAFTPDYTDNTVDAAYAADLNGDVWRFDLTPTGSNPYTVTKIAHLADSSGNAQAVTAQIELAIDPNTGKRYVLVGTGNLLDSSDISSAQTQTFYAIVDGFNAPGSFYGSTAPNTALPSGVSAFPITRANLANDSSPVAGVTVSSTQAGFFIDMPAGSSGAVYQIVKMAAADSGVVTFQADLPTSSNPCAPSGTHITYAVTLSQGQSILFSTTGTTIAYSGNGLGDGGAGAGLGEGSTIISANGQLVVVDTSDTGTINLPPDKFGATPSFQWLNWHEVDTSH